MNYIGFKNGSAAGASAPAALAFDRGGHEIPGCCCGGDLKTGDLMVISTWGLRSEQWLLLLGKSWENHGKTIGKP